MVNSDGKIYRLEGSDWRELPGAAATDIGVGANGAVWIVGAKQEPGGYGLYRRIAKSDLFEKVSGGATAVSVGPKGRPWVVNASTNIYRGKMVPAVPVPRSPRPGRLVAACPKHLRPVCGANGRTYGNSCEARAAGVTEYTPGRCGARIPRKVGAPAWRTLAGQAIHCAPGGCLQSGPGCDTRAVAGQCSFPRGSAKKRCASHPQCRAVTCNLLRGDCQARRGTKAVPWRGFTSYVRGP